MNQHHSKQIKSIKQFTCLRVFRGIELASSLPSVQPLLASEEIQDEEFQKDFYAYTLAKTYFDMKEFERAAHVSKNCQSSKGYFIHLYSLYMVSSSSKPFCRAWQASIKRLYPKCFSQKNGSPFQLISKHLNKWQTKLSVSADKVRQKCQLANCGCFCRFVLAIDLV